MDQVPSQLPGQTPAPPKATCPETVRALKFQAMRLSVAQRYRNYLQTHIFPKADAQKIIELGKKRHRDTMLSSDFYDFLVTIWKESEFVLIEDLAEVGMERNFERPGSLNCNSLGCSLAENPRDVNATTQYITTLVAIADAYRLVVQTPAHAKRNEIRGSDLLHEMMVALTPPQPADAADGVHNGTSPLDPTP